MRYIFILLILVCSESFAVCNKTGQVCIDNTPCKTQYGVDICLANINQTCWAYQDSYDCTTCGEITTSYCDPLAGFGCYQSDTPVCTSYDYAGVCLNTANTYRCDNKIDHLPDGVTYFREEKYIKTDIIQNNCKPQELNETCFLKSEVCVEPGGSRNINGYIVPKECWKWERTYSCSGEMDKSDCAEIQADPTCSEAKTTCTYANPDTGLCEVYEKVFSCRDGEDKVQTYTDCQGKVTCIGSYCFDSSYPPDDDFQRSTTMMEASREAGIYDLKGIFGGDKGTCHKDTTVGINSSCCDVTAQGDTANSNHYGASMNQISLGSTATMNAYNFMGSTYVHDFLFANSLVPEALLNKTFGIMGGSSFALGVTYYGVTVNFAVVNGSLKMGYSFNPWLMAAQLALTFIMDVVNCEMSEEEQLLSLRRGSGLCHFVGSWTKKKLLSKTTYESYCCFNSKLALIINQQGRAQLNKTWGTPQDPACEGFSEDEVGSIDFDNIDFTSFYAEIKPIELNSVNTQTIITDNVNCVAEDNGYDRAVNGNCNRDYRPGVVRDLPVLQFENN